MEKIEQLKGDYETLRLEYNECVHLIQQTIMRKSVIEQKMGSLSLEITNLKKSLEKA